MEARKMFLILILLILLCLSAVVWFYPPTGDFEADNPFWNGLSAYSSQAKAKPLDDLTNLPPVSKGTALITVPYEQFSQNELSQLKNYVSNGGTLVVMDDYGYGNQILSSLGLAMKFAGQPLLDPLYDYRNEWLPKITDFTATAVNANVSSIVFNHATCLEDTSNATVLASSSSFSFLDVNENGVFDSGELNGPFPVAAYVKIDQGYLVAVADPSLLINGMLKLDDNSRFINNIVNIQGPTSQIFVDQTHLPKSPLGNSKAFLAAVYEAVAYPRGIPEFNPHSSSFIV